MIQNSEKQIYFCRKMLFIMTLNYSNQNIFKNAYSFHDNDSVLR